MVEMLVQVNALIKRGVHIKTLYNRLDTAAMPEELVKLVVGVMGYAAEMELKSMKERTAEVRAVAQSRGCEVRTEEDLHRAPGSGGDAEAPGGTGIRNDCSRNGYVHGSADRPNRCRLSELLARTLPSRVVRMGYSGGSVRRVVNRRE